MQMSTKKSVDGQHTLFISGDNMEVVKCLIYDVFDPGTKITLKEFVYGLRGSECIVVHCSKMREGYLLHVTSSLGITTYLQMKLRHHFDDIQLTSYDKMFNPKKASTQ